MTSIATFIDFPQGWELVDTSGDGGTSGYHLLLIYGGKIAVTLGASSGTNILGDFSWTVTSKDVPVYLGFHYLDGYKRMYIEHFTENDVMADTYKHELFFRDLKEALEFLNWVPMYIPSA